MRLIDADELIKTLRYRASENAIMGYLTAYDVTNSIVEDVKEQPTAYDIDKVVEELEELREIDMCDIALCPIENIACSDCTHNRMVDKSIEIVKQGGVSDDVCEWKKRVKTYDWEPSCEPNSTYNVEGVGWFKYCPYCRKKIKVVE